MHLSRRLAATALLASAVLALSAAPTAADCQPAGPIERVLPKADTMFVGSVVRTDGPVATFAVIEVWAGDVAATVEVRGLSDRGGGPDTGFGAGFAEDDRRWTDGATYLVVPFVDGAVLRDHICTATTEWSDDLEALRPATARVVEGEPAGGVSVPPALLLSGLVVLLVAGASAFAFRRR